MVSSDGSHCAVKEGNTAVCERARDSHAQGHLLRTPCIGWSGNRAAGKTSMDGLGGSEPLNRTSPAATNAAFPNGVTARDRLFFSLGTWQPFSGDDAPYERPPGLFFKLAAGVNTTILVHERCIPLEIAE